MLVVLGEKIRIKLSDHGRIRVLRGGMMYDEKGTYWPKNSLLITRFDKRHGRPATDEEYQGMNKSYLGRHYEPFVSMVDLPTRDLREWKKVGNVHTVYYVRNGTRAPGGYRHTFNKPRGMQHIIFAVKGKGEVVLLRYKDFYRIDMPFGCMIDSRGIVWP